MKKLLVFLLINAILGVVYWYYKLPNVIERVRPSAVLIQVQDKCGILSYGSGMLVGNGLILTAGHVIEDANNVCIEFDDGTKIKSSTFFTVKTIDAGLIIIEDFDGGLSEGLCLKVMPSSIGDVVFTVGSPFRLKNSVAVGILSAYDRNILNTRVHQLDLAINPGMSGCPVFDRYGRVVGMAVSRYSGSGVGFMLPSETCQFVIDVYENVQRAKTK